MQDDSVRVVLQAARRATRATDAPLLLAVSGGLDSMALLVAMATVARARIAAVATFDHGTGAVAARAIEHVAQAAHAFDLPCVSGRADAGERPHGGREATWRDARHTFLRSVVRSHCSGARVTTAHTEDDQIETVLMRLMRGSGTRGLAALLAPNGPLRPFVGVRRETLRRYLTSTGHRWIEDPSNESREFFRNRVRHDLLPALRRAQPAIDQQLLDTGRRAAAWRGEMERVVNDALAVALRPDGSLLVPAAELDGYPPDSLPVLWSSLAGRAGLALDRRGTARLAAFTTMRRSRGSMPLAAGWRVEARPDHYLLRRDTAHVAAPMPLPHTGTLDWGDFRFRHVESSSRASAWTAEFPAGERPTVRAWGAGDRLAGTSRTPPRRVKRYLSDAGLRGSERSGWPVVLAGDDVVWIPGVRRSNEAIAPSGGQVRHYVCERINR